jgi:hypothetical protein
MNVEMRNIVVKDEEVPKIRVISDFRKLMIINFKVDCVFLSIQTEDGINIMGIVKVNQLRFNGEVEGSKIENRFVIIFKGYRGWGCELER